MKNAIIDKNKIAEKDVKKLVNKADAIIKKTIKKINYELINMYWNIGKIIVEYKKKNNSKYGDTVIEQFNEKLSYKHGKGFSISNIKFAVQFFNTFQKSSPASQFKNISWSHYREALVIRDIDKISYYLNEVESKNLTKLELRQCIRFKSYERTISNQRKGIANNKIEKTLKDPVILNIKNKKRSEKELEKEILNNISNFKREIGPNVMFFEPQYRININGLIHKVDLVFFDNKINSYILIDLKINKVTNRDIFQMQMYVDYFNKNKKEDRFNNTIGIILCETKDLRVVNNENIYQIKYLNEIPKEKELFKIIDENKIILLKTENLLKKKM